MWRACVASGACAWWRLAVALAAASPVALPGVALAQGQDTAQSPASYGRVRGVVYDSLLHSVLIGAQVALARGLRSAVTDRNGQFVLDTVPTGRQVVTFWRSDLDSIGLSTFAGAVTVVAGREATLHLAVPSRNTYWRAACHAAPPSGADSGLVFGRIVDAETRVPVAGAHATLSWLSTSWDGHRVTIGHPSREVEADSQGWYYVCGVPEEYLAWARALLGPFTSGLAELLIDIRGITRQDLSLSREEVPAADTATPPHRHGLATVVGTVRGERGGVLPGSVASLDDTPDVAETDSAGRFVLRNAPSGTDMLMVRRIGYFATRKLVELANRDTAHVSIALSEATMLDTLRVFATSQTAARIEEIDERRRTGFGFFKSRSEIRARHTVRSLFEDIPGVLTTGSDYAFAIQLRNPTSVYGTCRAMVYIDGFPAVEEQLGTTPVDRIVALEVYTRETAALGRFGAGFGTTTGVDMGAGNAPALSTTCGVVLVWTDAAF